MAIAETPGRGREVDGADLSAPCEEEVVAVRVALDQVHAGAGSARADRNQVPAEALHPASREGVERADERTVEEGALPAAVQATLHGETFRHQLHLAESCEEPVEAGVRVGPDDRGIDVFEVNLHQ